MRFTGYHGTRWGLPQFDPPGGIHVGTMRAAEERLDVVGTYVNPVTKEHDFNALSDILKVRVTLKNPLGSRENPVEDYATYWNAVIPKLKEAGYDGIIYRNVQEDEGSISVCAFYRSSIEVAE